MRVIRFAMSAAVLTTTLSACATKGFVRRNLEDQRVALTSSMTQSMSQERGERTAGDAALGTDVAALKAEMVSLRNDLQGLKTDFGARITAVEGQIQFAMPVHFGFDDAAVRQADQAALERFAKVANSHYKGAKITIEGFADPAGSVAYNLKLSRERADAVRDYLVTKGIDGTLLKTVGYGKTRLVKAGAQGTTAGAELNRRVTFVIEAPAETTVAVLTSR